jgi:hypothetical protein
MPGSEESMVRGIQEHVIGGEGEETGLEGKARLAQGPLLLLRNVVPHVPWQLVGSCPEAAGKLRDWLLDLLALGEQAAHLAITLLEDAPNTGLPSPPTPPHVFQVALPPPGIPV